VSAASKPITTTELAETFKKPVAVAVSGGPDSMALLLLLKKSGARIHALTVDHRLREDSTAEAKQVASWCKNLDIPHTILTWNHDGITSGLQQQARDARYSLMLNWCRENNFEHLATAHHLDDQIETFIFRLLRQSGIEGLSAMLPTTCREGIFLHRPLLSFPKYRLIATLENHPFITDPSNQNMRYTRNELRSMLESLTPEMKERFGAVIQSFRHFRQAFEVALSQAIERCFSFHKAGYGELDFKLFFAEPYEMQTRIINHICMMMSGNASPIRSEKITHLVDALSTLKKITLHGVTFQFTKQNTWLIMREFKRIEAPKHFAPHPQLWDGRFMIPAGEPHYRIAPLGTYTKPFTRQLERANIPKTVWPSISGIWHLEECIAIPHIEWNGPDALMQAINLPFIPAKMLAGQCGWAMN